MKSKEKWGQKQKTSYWSCVFKCRGKWMFLRLDFSMPVAEWLTLWWLILGHNLRAVPGEPWSPLITFQVRGTVKLYHACILFQLLHYFQCIFLFLANILNRTYVAPSFGSVYQRNAAKILVSTSLIPSVIPRSFLHLWVSHVSWTTHNHRLKHILVFVEKFQSFACWYHRSTGVAGPPGLRYVTPAWVEGRPSGCEALLAHFQRLPRSGPLSQRYFGPFRQSSRWNQDLALLLCNCVVDTPFEV